MAELTKILEKEETQRKAVETAKKEAQAELGKKKQDLASELEAAGITKAQEDKVLKYKDQQIKEIKKTTEEALKTRLQELQKKEQANFNKAVEYVVKSLFME